MDEETRQRFREVIGEDYLETIAARLLMNEGMSQEEAKAEAASLEAQNEVLDEAITRLAGRGISLDSLIADIAAEDAASVFGSISLELARMAERPAKPSAAEIRQQAGADFRARMFETDPEFDQLRGTLIGDMYESHVEKLFAKAYSAFGASGTDLGFTDYLERWLVTDTFSDKDRIEREPLTIADFVAKEREKADQILIDEEDFRRKHTTDLQKAIELTNKEKEARAKADRLELERMRRKSVFATARQIGLLSDDSTAAEQLAISEMADRLVAEQDLADLTGTAFNFETRTALLMRESEVTKMQADALATGLPAAPTPELFTLQTRQRIAELEDREARGVITDAERTALQDARDQLSVQLGRTTPTLPADWDPEEYDRRVNELHADPLPGYERSFGAIVRGLVEEEDLTVDEARREATRQLGPRPRQMTMEEAVAQARSEFGLSGPPTPQGLPPGVAGQLLPPRFVPGAPAPEALGTTGQKFLDRLIKESLDPATAELADEDALFLTQLDKRIPFLQATFEEDQRRAEEAHQAAIEEQRADIREFEDARRQAEAARSEIIFEAEGSRITAAQRISAQVQAANVAELLRRPGGETQVAPAQLLFPTRPRAQTFDEFLETRIADERSRFDEERRKPVRPRRMQWDPTGGVTWTRAIPPAERTRTDLPRGVR
jgi:hypothetical protein